MGYRAGTIAGPPPRALVEREPVVAEWPALGGAGADRLFGGTGADFLRSGPGRDRLVGGTGEDNSIP